jgi:release factor glutamine methyltransferase
LIVTADESMKVEEALDLGASVLPRRVGLPDPRREAHWLLAHAWGREEIWLRLYPDAEVPDDVAERYSTWLARRAAGEPGNHLTGTCTFWGREFEVSAAVLIPRPETELVVETSLSLPIAGNARVLDVGTGSGCLAITLATERKAWRVAGVDRSLAAIRVARANRERHGVDVLLVSGDLGGSCFGGFDLVVANLPYIPRPQLATLPVEVRRDPGAALDGGVDGLDLIRRLLADLPRLLRPCGGAVLELGENQADEVADLASAAGLAVARRVRDVGGCERVVVVERR